MTVTEFVKLDMGGYMYKVVDARQNGYLTKPDILIEAGKSVVRKNFPDSEVVGFDIATKRSLYLYIK